MIDNPGSKKIVGYKQTLKSIMNNSAQVVYVALDADEKITDSVVEASKKFGIEVVYFDTMEELGKFCKIDVGAAAACMLQ